jgi:hypothetical protein
MKNMIIGFDVIRLDIMNFSGESKIVFQVPLLVKKFGVIINGTKKAKNIPIRISKFNLGTESFMFNDMPIEAIKKIRREKPVEPGQEVIIRACVDVPLDLDRIIYLGFYIEVEPV